MLRATIMMRCAASIFAKLDSTSSAALRIGRSADSRRSLGLEPPPFPIFINVFRYRSYDNEMQQDDSPEAREFEHRELLSGLVRMHVLHHAAQEEIYGTWLIDELASHGYRLSPGTLYPMLHKLVEAGYLTVRSERDGKTVRKYYSATEKGRAGLAVARERMQVFIRAEPERG